MSGDGVKTARRKRARTQRNKIVTVLTTLATAASTVDTSVPGLVPPGAGILTGQLLGCAAVLVNQFWPK